MRIHRESANDEGFAIGVVVGITYGISVAKSMKYSTSPNVIVNVDSQELLNDCLLLGDPDTLSRAKVKYGVGFGCCVIE